MFFLADTAAATTTTTTTTTATYALRKKRTILELWVCQCEVLAGPCWGVLGASWVLVGFYSSLESLNGLKGILILEQEAQG